MAFASIVIFAIGGSVSAIDKADFRINDDFGTAPQSTPQIAVQANGEFFVVWVDRRTGLNDLYYQRFDAEGNSLERNSLLTTTDSTSSERFQVSIAASVAGSYTAVWKDFRNGSFPFNPDIYHTFFDSTGQPSGAEFNWTEQSVDSIFEDPDVALGSDGSGVVVWAEHSNRNWDIVAERFDADGVRIGSKFIVNDTGVVGQQHSPSVSISTLGWFVVSWYDNRDGNDDIYFQVYDVSGNPIGANVRAHKNINSRQAFPDVACDGSGKFTLCWVDWRNGAYPQNPDIYMRRFSSNGVALDTARSVHSDSSATPQREPSIATDRLGNVIIVWADSSSSDWNIRGRVVDQLGEFVDSTFQINTDTTIGRQAQPVVAMDGFDIRVAWADYRNGNFDIYGRIMNYNQPALIVLPNALEFSMHTTGPAPVSDSVSLLNAGIGELGFEIIDTVSWLTVSTTSGVTPTTVTITINEPSPTLAPGSYFASLQVIDVTNADSSIVINVSLTVTTSEFDLALSADTLVALAQLGTPASAQIVVGNSGSGDLNWQAVVGPTPWLSLSANSGGNNDTVIVIADPTGLNLGYYDGYIVFTDALAVNSPDTIRVTLKFASDVPYITFSEDTVRVSILSNESYEAGVQVFNAGGDTLRWSASTSLSWVDLLLDTGVGGDSLLFSLPGNTLAPGSYSGTLTVADTAALNSPRGLALELNVAHADTVYFSSYTAAVGGQVELELSLALHDSARSIHIPLVIDTSLFTFDTLYSLLTDTVSDYSASWSYDSLSGFLTIDYAPVGDSVVMLPEGSVPLARILLRGATHNFTIPTTQFLRGDDRLAILYSNGRNSGPYLSHGQITVGVVTGVGDDESVVLPQTMTVSQNYPNPFNPEMQFDIVLPRSSDLRVRIYNVLGQTVRTLYSAPASSGGYTLRWDGQTSSGRQAPSGVYFYEVKTFYSRIVRKALLLK
ncbi:T9SS type A sorting domain-containing protein [bacterium AH-315-J21]|nr:T9SS type A sorting domain-containing protein [bacterium AH-315-J21]